MSSDTQFPLMRSIGRALPQNYYPQEEISAALWNEWAGRAAGLARAADYLRAFPAHTAVLLSVELCSLTLQLQDKSVANVIASGLFADGAAAVLLMGGARPDTSPTPRIVASRSMFFHDTEEMMAWR